MKIIKGASVVAAALLAAPVYASTIAIGNGIEWSLVSNNVGQSAGSITLHGDVSGSTLGDVRLAAFEIKSDAGLSVASASVLGGGWTWKMNELSANGCSGGSHPFNMCFAANDIGSSLTDNSNIDLVINYSLSSGLLPDLLHLKVDWNQFDPCATSHSEGRGRSRKSECDGGWTKVGSLISEDVEVVATPVPGTLGLLGMGLAGLGCIRRKRASTDT